MKAIEINKINKSFGSAKALVDVDVEVENGELFGFIGPDGAGKTTLFRIITTLLLPDSGSAKVLGLDPNRDYKKLRTKLGYMPGRFSLYQDLTVEENLRFFASIFNSTIEENYHLIKDVYEQIEPFKKRRAGKLSGGMKQKLALSCALIHKPELLALDEPTTGVDAVSRIEFWEMLKKLQKQGITIIVSTPYMDEASLCDRVALIQKGRVLQVDTPEAVASGFEKKLFAVKSRNKHKLARALEKYEFANSAYPFGESFHYTDVREDFNPAALAAYLKSEEIADAQIAAIKPNIEDSFMALMRKNEND